MLFSGGTMVQLQCRVFHHSAVEALDYNNSKQRLPSVMDAKHIEDLVRETR